MQVVSRKRPDISEAIARLSLYSSPPPAEVNLDELEQFGLARVRVLREIDNARVRGLKGESFNKAITAVLSKELPLRAASAKDDMKRDEFSHFILRLAFADTTREDHRRWFIQKEIELFKLKFQSETPAARLTFFKSCNFGFQEITPVHLKQYENDLAVVRRIVEHLAPGETVSTDYYEIPFHEVPDLVGKRLVLVKRGIAFVPQSDVLSLVVTRYRAILSKEMTVLGRKYPTVASMEKDRLVPLLERLANFDPAAQLAASGERSDKVSVATLDQLARSSFPLCMRHLHNTLRSVHHLKHGGRMQYGLFLKGIGLTLEESLEFWKTEFSKSMPPDKFDKEHAYNIRHNYGMEGKHTSYSPFSCIKIINGQRGPDEAHGCPFKHFEVDRLQILLRDCGLGDDTVREASDLARGHHYQVACQRVFEATHPGYSGPAVADHPNQYFTASMKHHKEAAGGDAKVAAVADLPAPAPSS